MQVIASTFSSLIFTPGLSSDGRVCTLASQHRSKRCGPGNWLWEFDSLPFRSQYQQGVLHADVPRVRDMAWRYERDQRS